MAGGGLDLNLIRTAAFSLLPLIGLLRLWGRYRTRKKEEIPLGSALNDAWIRAEVKRGNRPRAMRAYRELHHANATDARAAIDAIEAELKR